MQDGLALHRLDRNVEPLGHLLIAPILTEGSSARMRRAADPTAAIDSMNGTIHLGLGLGLDLDLDRRPLPCHPRALPV